MVVFFALAKSLCILEKKGNYCLLIIQVIWARNIHMVRAPCIVISEAPDHNHSAGGKDVIKNVAVCSDKKSHAGKADG